MFSRVNIWQIYNIKKYQHPQIKWTRPGGLSSYSNAHKVTVKLFLTEFGTLMQHALTSPGLLVVLRYLNLHVDDTSCAHTRQFIDLITSFGLIQHIV